MYEGSKGLECCLPTPGKTEAGGLALAPRCEGVSGIIVFYQIIQVFQTPFDTVQYRS